MKATASNPTQVSPGLPKCKAAKTVDSTRAAGQKPMPSVSVVRDRLITGIARGYAGLDCTALGLIAAEEAGLSVAPPVN